MPIPSAVLAALRRLPGAVHRGLWPGQGESASCDLAELRAGGARLRRLGPAGDRLDALHGAFERPARLPEPGVAPCARPAMATSHPPRGAGAAADRTCWAWRAIAWA